LPERPRVLLIRPDHLGDLLMTSPTVELLREAMPRAHLTMMVGPWSADLARRDPLLDDLLVCRFPGFTREPKGSPLAPYRLLWQTAGEVRRRRYDAALLLRFDHWWGAWLAALAGVPIRVGHAVAECRPFLTHSIDPPGRGHWVERSLETARRLLGAWGIQEEAASHRPGLRFVVREEEARAADRLLAEMRASPRRPLVAFHPGTGSPLKLWPEGRWIVLGWTLAARGARILVTGSAAEGGMAERIAGAIPDGRSLAGRTDLGTLAALFRRCALVVGADNGPLHLAVAVGVPSVHLFGPTDPSVFGPWGDAARHRVVAAEWAGAPCGWLDLVPAPGVVAPCMEAIPVEKVAAECVELLGRHRK
jgi:ADP-heptose:LPS heptosyltransferase